MKRKICLFLASLLLVAFRAAAEGENADGLEALSATRRPVRSELMVEVGRSHLLSTYLSPLVYNGPSLALEARWGKAMPFDSSRWRMEFRFSAEGSPARNHARNAIMLQGLLRFSWGMERVWSPAGGTLGAGASVSAEAGGLWLTRNGNNPVAANCACDLNLTLSLARPFTLAGKRLVAFNRFTLPSLGLFFSPAYGETYYEISLGNHAGLIHGGWWGNRFGLDNILGLEMPLGRRSLLMGWRCRLSSSWVNSINTQTWRHSASVGIIF